MKVNCLEEAPAERRQATATRRASRGSRTSRTRLLLFVWMVLGLAPLLLQARSFVHFVTPHKISLHLIAPVDAEVDATDLHESCPVQEMHVAGVWWNISPTHYFQAEKGRLCHIVIPQYNVHGVYFLSTEKVSPSSNTPKNCAEDSFSLSYYFYHGSIRYYAFYQEGTGTFCATDSIGYVSVSGLGSYDSNGASLAGDRATSEYRRSYWYGFVGSIWIAYRCSVLRRGYVLCQRYGRRCDHNSEPIQLKDAVVYAQESMRLSAHGATNYQRAALLYLLIEGVMSELFMLIATDGTMGRVQYIPLGYNLAGVMSMLFEMLEAMHWTSGSVLCLFKRLLFNYETVLFGELICAGVLQHYLTALNRSSLKDTKNNAEAASYYLWSLVGHGAIVLGCVLVLVSVRTAGALGFVRWRYGSTAVLTASCSVDTALGGRCKLAILGGYVWEGGDLFYEIRTLRSLGIMIMTAEDGREYIALQKMYWLAIPRDDLVVIGVVSNQRVVPCEERPCVGEVGLIDQRLGGKVGTGSQRRLAGNKVANGPSSLHLPRVP